jgi:hypothetical protein
MTLCKSKVELTLLLGFKISTIMSNENAFVSSGVIRFMGDHQQKTLNFFAG